jgi:hypothetical protein
VCLSYALQSAAHHVLLVDRPNNNLFAKRYELRSYSLCSLPHLPVISSFLGANTYSSHDLFSLESQWDKKLDE